MKNTHLRYGTVAQTLHWVMAFIILGVFLTIEFSEVGVTSTDGEAGHTHVRDPHLLNAHMLFGLSVLVFVIPRLVWRLVNPQPAPPLASSWQVFVARWLHRVLYFLMFAMPISGWMFVRKHPDLGAFALPNGNDVMTAMGLSDGVREGIAGAFYTFHHGIGNKLLFVLILIHIAAALHHHYRKRNEILVRMLPHWAVRDTKP